MFRYLWNDTNTGRNQFSEWRQLFGYKNRNLNGMLMVTHVLFRSIPIWCQYVVVFLILVSLLGDWTRCRLIGWIPVFSRIISDFFVPIEFFTIRLNLHFKAEFTSDKLKQNKSSKKMATVWMQSRTSCDLHWWLPACAKLMFGCQSKSLTPSYNHTLLILEFISLM